MNGSEVGMALGSLRAVTTVAKTFLDARRQQDLDMAVAGVTDQLLATQAKALALDEKHSTLKDRCVELEAHIKKLEDWARKEVDRELIEFASGVFCFVTKGRMQELQSTVKYCAPCHYERKESVLQKSPKSTMMKIVFCPRCKTELNFTAYK